MSLDLPTSTWDRPATDDELDSFYGGTPLTKTAIELGKEQVCKKVELFADFIGGDIGEREFCDYFQYISVSELVRKFLLNPKANDEQLAAAARELRTRYLADKEELVLELAAKEMRS